MNSDSYLSTSTYNFKPIFNINLLFMFALVFLQFACEDNLNKNENERERLLFISSEGNFGQSNGSISVFDGNKKSPRGFRSRWRTPIDFNPWRLSFCYPQWEQWD